MARTRLIAKQPFKLEILLLSVVKNKKNEKRNKIIKFKKVDIGSYKAACRVLDAMGAFVFKLFLLVYSIAVINTSSN